jgi:hypothetical protein
MEQMVLYGITLYGITELAREIKWTKTKTHTYYLRGHFEEPAAKAGKRPLWSLEQVQRIKNNV